MKLKRMVSVMAALAVSATTFAGMAVTVNAETFYNLNLSGVQERVVSPLLTNDNMNNPASVTAEEIAACNVDDFESIEPALDGWGYIHAAFSNMTNLGRQTQVNVTKSAVVLSSVGNSGVVGTLTFTPSNISSISMPTEGEIYYSFTATVASTTKNSISMPIGFNKNSGASLEAVGNYSLTANGNSSTPYSIYMTYDLDDNTYELKVNNEIKASGTESGISGIYARSHGGRYGSISLSDVEFGLVDENNNRSYTINYVNNGQTIKSVTGSAMIGETIYAQDKITDDSNNRYFIEDGATSSITIVDGENILEVPVRPANIYTLSVVGSEGSTFVSETTVIEGDTFTYSYPKYLTNANNQVTMVCSDSVYTKTVTPTDNQQIVVNYNKYTKIGKFAEQEALADNATLASGNFSGGTAMRGVTEGVKAFTVDTTGVYTVTVVAAARNVDNSSTYSVYKNNAETVIASGDAKGCSQNGPLVSVTENVALEEGDTIILAADIGNTYVDYILIEATIPSAVSATHVLDYTDETAEDAATGASLWQALIEGTGTAYNAFDIAGTIKDAEGVVKTNSNQYDMRTTISTGDVYIYIAVNQAVSKLADGQTMELTVTPVSK